MDVYKTKDSPPAETGEVTLSLWPRVKAQIQRGNR